MGILNYTTEIAVETTILDIEKILAKGGVDKILKEYDGAGNILAVSFMVKTEQGNLPFKLPMNAKAVLAVLNKQTEEYRSTKSGRERVVPRKFYNDLEQARKVGWRIIKDWLEAQMALYQLQMVKIQEIFLSYMIGIDGKTLYENLEQKGFKSYLLEDKHEN